MTDFLKSLPRPVRREALRTLRGHILRTELYAPDGTDWQSRPYTVTEHLYGVCAVVDDDNHSRLVCDRDALPPTWSAETTGQHIFFPSTLADRTTQWERGDKPMTQFTFTSDYDAYGQPRAHTTIAVPRERDFRVEAAPGEPYLATHTLTAYAQRDDEQCYITDQVARTTTYEILNDGRASVFLLQKDIEAGTANRRISAQTLNFYDGPAFEGLPFRQIDHFGALMRTEQLVLTKEMLHEAYKSDTAVSTPPEEPLYLATGGSPLWSDEYPQEFRTYIDALLAGYTYQPGGADSEYETGYFAATERRSYDFHHPDGKERGLVKVMRDPFGHDTTIEYDEQDHSYRLLPTKVTDPANLTTQAKYDYRILQPKEVIDPNDNHTTFTFTPLGLLASSFVKGKGNEGDQKRPSVRMEYAFSAFDESSADTRQPIFVRTIRQSHHDTETDVALPERDETITTVEYSDGFGRLLQTRTQAEDITFGGTIFGDAGLPVDQLVPNQDAIGHVPCLDGGDRVVVSGWQTYDNKGRVIEKYESFFSCSWEYVRPTAEQLGQKITMYYDPRGQVIRTVNPDRSEQRIIYGIPADLTNPDQFTPTVWEVYTYDANDNAGCTHPTVSVGYQDHWNTPSNVVVDALGRTIQSVERNGTNATTDWYITRSTYDIRGNLLTVTDALNRLAFQHVYDLANRLLRIEQLDAGIRRIIIDAAGNILEQRDSKGTLVLHAYDTLNRPTRLWARDGTTQSLTLREKLVYGDDPNSGLKQDQAAAGNLLGQLYQHYDEAGRVTFVLYDFKGNLLEKERQVIADTSILAVFNPPPANWEIQAFRVDWETPSGTSVDATTYTTTLAYDALNRIKTMLYPKDVGGMRKLLRPHYNRAGALESVTLDSTPYVEHIAYNAKVVNALRSERLLPSNVSTCPQC